MKVSVDLAHIFLYYGYIPAPRRCTRVASCMERLPMRSLGNVSERKLIDVGAEMMAQAFSGTADVLCGRAAVIPISGGMDSRAILGGMIDHYPRDNIRTVTFGIPGALDYEIGRLVADHAGVKNEIVNLDRVNWNEDDLINFAANTKRLIPVFEGYLFSRIYRYVSEDEVVLSGFMGDPLAGSHLPEKSSSTWEVAKQRFIKRGCYAGKQYFTNREDLLSSCLPSEPFCLPDLISYDEQLDFFVRQRFGIKPLVYFEGYKHLAPFLDPEWIRYAISLPKAFRQNQMLYKKILLRLYPNLFRLPVKSNRGLPLHASNVRHMGKRFVDRIVLLGSQYLPCVFGRNSYLNYIDFDEAFRSDSSLRDIGEKNINNLAERNLIKDLELNKLWNEHLSRRQDLGRLLMLLISLELYIKAGRFGD